MTGERWHAILILCRLLALGTAPDQAAAQHDECALINQLALIDAPARCIAKSLAQKMGRDQSDVQLERTSRDAARAGEAGAAAAQPVHDRPRAESRGPQRPPRRGRRDERRPEAASPTSASGASAVSPPARLLEK